ncbi:MAG: biotin/lipoyl-binding protein [Planctomycetes bacterium]|nr:biotin/lipoyl-binding protein [Planctomycetota bacterium]
MSKSLILPMLSGAMLLFAAHHVISREQPVEQGSPPLQPAESPFSEQIAAAGLVEARSENIRIGTPLSGIVEQVYVTVGETVRPGEPLFRLDTRQIAADVAAAEAKLKSAEAELSRLEAMPRPEDLPPVEAQRREAEAAVGERADAFRRAQLLFERAVATDEELTIRRAKLEVAQAQLERIIAEERRLRAGTWSADKAVSAAHVAGARAELEQARVQLQRHTIAAPAVGPGSSADCEFVVLQVDVHPGESVSERSMQPLIVLGDVRAKYVRIDIDEHDIPRYRAELTAIGLVRGDGEVRYPLKFIRIEPYVVPKQSLTGENTERVDTRVLRVLYQIDENGRPPVYIGQQMEVFMESVARRRDEEPMSAARLFPTSVVGSLPRPEYVKDLIFGRAAASTEEYRRLMESAVRSVVALQEAAGLDVLTDGEWWRRSYIGVIAELAHGFELSTNPADGRPWTIVVDRLAAKQPGFIAREVRFLKQITAADIKATLPAPALLGERMWDAERSRAAYPTRDAFVRDCVPILRREVELLRDEGVAVVQIDDPHLCLFVDDTVRAQHDDAERASDFAVDMTNEVVSGIEGVKFAVHLCRRAGARARGDAAHRGGYEPIIRQLNRLSVQHLTMEFTNPGAGDMSVFRQLREEFEIGLGCVSCQPGEIDSVEDIVSRVERALEHLAPERITLNPDCGFAPGSAAVVSIDEVYGKLKNEVEAARRLREKYG